MSDKKIITASKVKNWYYWRCPYSKLETCKSYHDIQLPGKFPIKINCSCGAEYLVEEILTETTVSARILIRG